MSITLIKSLYQRADSKRKKVLYETFKDTFHSPYSCNQTVLSINEALGEEIIKIADVKYIREKIMNKKQKVLKKATSISNQTSTTDISEEIAKSVQNFNLQNSEEKNSDFSNKFLNK
jgi:hypothetical protein